LRQHSTGCVFYVDPNHLDASDAHDGTDPNHPLATVAHAITHCEDYRGDVIAVMANGGWQYAKSGGANALPIAEEVTLNVAGVRLVGVAPAGTVGVVWEPVTPAGAGTCITVTGTDCLIEGFSFQGATVGGNAISAIWNGTTAYADNLIVRHCLFDADIDIGIQLDYTYFVEVSDCWFQNLDAQAIYADPADSAPANLSIHDNWFINCLGGALAISETTDSLITHNYIYNADAQSGAACTNEGINTSAGAGQNIVSDNFLSCTLGAVYADFNSGDPTDAWIGNHLMDGVAVTIP
jgi:hypothetical protein